MRTSAQKTAAFLQASDAATVLAVRLSRKPADHDHPYGHGRYETVGALTVSGMVALSGMAIGARNESKAKQRNAFWAGGRFCSVRNGRFAKTDSGRI
eukprot:COSAG06_NODE_4224_length_4453_cov_275.939136_5_plen_97_part_00